MSHTPGPWEQYAPRIDDVVDPYYRRIVAGELGGLRGEGGFNLTGFVSESDARLIAAAPELLQACKLVEMWMLGQQPAPHSDALLLEVVRTAIAKAEGVPSC